MRTLIIVAKGIVWLLWVTVLIAAILSQQFRAEDSSLEGPLIAIFPLGMLLIPTFVALGIRWLLIPKLRHPLAAAVLAMIGILVAYSVPLYGVVLFQKYRLLYLAIGLLGILQFVPIGLFPRKGTEQR